MKFKIKKNNSSLVFDVEIPSDLNINFLSVGEKFQLFILNHNLREEVQACFIADKKSILIGHEVYRLNRFKNLNSYEISLVRPVMPKKRAVSKGYGLLKSPMTGKILSVNVKNDDVVAAGDVLLIIEAMKMENRICAQAHGMVKLIKVTEGTSISAGEPLLTLEQQAS